MMDRPSYFPAVIQYIDEPDVTTVATAEDIRPGVAFGVVQIAPTASGRRSASPFDLGCTCEHCDAARISKPESLDKRLNIEELTTRQTEYLGEVRRALYRSKSVSDANERIKEAQDSYIAWFAERGINAYISLKPKTEGDHHASPCWK